MSIDFSVGGVPFSVILPVMVASSAALIKLAPASNAAATMDVLDNICFIPSFSFYVFLFSAFLSNRLWFDKRNHSVQYDALDSPMRPSIQPAFEPSQAKENAGGACSSKCNRGTGVPACDFGNLL